MLGQRQRHLVFAVIIIVGDTEAELYSCLFFDAINPFPANDDYRRFLPLGPKGFCRPLCSLSSPLPPFVWLLLNMV